MAELVFLFGVLFAPCFNLNPYTVKVCDDVGSEGVVAKESLDSKMGKGWWLLWLIGVIKHIKIDS